MKKILLILALAALPCIVFGQGRVAFRNSSTTALRTNLTIIGGPVGVTDGANQYYVALFIAAPGTTDESSFAIAHLDGTGADALTFNQSGAAFRGQFNGGSQFALQGNNGAPIAFQVRAWTASLGSDYATALATWTSQTPSGSRLLGRSGIGSVTPATGTAITPNLFGTGAGQLAGFDLVPNIPEPSSIALGLLGLGAIALFRRRK